MIEIQQEALRDSNESIRITGLNKDKTRKTDGAGKRYQVYFELSGTPVQAWITILEKVWKALNPAESQMSADVYIDNKFLVVYCSLQEIADKYFPVLKKAVEATNTAYQRYASDAAAEHRHRVDVWTDERKAVDDIEKLLKFE
jgi:hypothetical protein